VTGQNEYDVVVLGAGPVGQTVADRSRAAGLTVAVVERELVGGECSYRLGTTPDHRRPVRRTPGPGIAELLHSATVAVAGQVRMDRLWHAVPAFPTISEAWLRLLEAYRG
jgi:dihydrolipoamide dehydrogenase